MNEKMYSVAIRKRLDIDDHFWFHENYKFNECKLDTCNGRYWFADPFLYEKDDKIYLFYEAFDLIEHKGKEAYSIMGDDGTWSTPCIIIDEAYHLSFPYIFDYDGDTYIMPEMCGDYSLKLYKAIEFPDKWMIANTVIPDVFACDSVIVEKAGNRFLLTNEMYHNVPNNQYASCYVKNYIYPMDGLYVCGDGIKISEGDYGIRNAGKTFMQAGKLYRIGQDCRERMYGRGMVLFEIESIQPYIEKIVNCWSCEDLEKHIARKSDERIVGSHTYNFSEHYEIIDYSFIKEVSPFVIKERKRQRVLSILRRIKNKLNIVYEGI